MFTCSPIKNQAAKHKRPPIDCIFGKFVPQNILTISMDKIILLRKCLYIALMNYMHFLLLSDLKPGRASSRKPTKDTEVFLKSLLRKLNKSICISSTKWSAMQQRRPLCHIRTNYYCPSYIHIPSSSLPSTSLPFSSLTCSSLPYFSRPSSMTSSPMPSSSLPSSSLPSSPCPPTPTVLLSSSPRFQRKSICFNMFHFYLIHFFPAPIKNQAAKQKRPPIDWLHCSLRDSHNTGEAWTTATPPTSPISKANN